MQDTIKAFFSEEAIIHDEFDDLCRTLLQVTPPDTLIEQIMAAVQQLPRPQAQSTELLEAHS